MGIGVEAGRLSLVALEGEVEGRPFIKAWETIPVESLEEQGLSIQQFVDRHRLAGQRCRCVIPALDYSLRLVERPPGVPDEELVDATRWLVRDLVEFDIETAGFAIFKVPDGGSRVRTPRMFVVAARHESVSELARMIEAAGLELASFEIVESAMLALEARMPEAVAGGGLIRIDDKSSVLTLAKAADLYLSRNVHVDSDSIEEAARVALEHEDPADPEIMSMIDGLLLDLQRSLDYYESEYGQAPASRLCLLPSQIDMTPLIPTLAEAFRPMQVEIFEASNLLSFDDSPPSAALPSVLLAVGAALADESPIEGALVPGEWKAGGGGLDLDTLGRVAAGVAAIVAIYLGFSAFALTTGRTALQERDAVRLALIDSIEQEQEKARIRAAASDPEARLASLRAQRAAGLATLRDIEHRGADSRSSFSSLLTGLARQDLEGVWLERIEIDHAGDSVSIEGRALDAADVPRFLRRLGNEQSFGNRRFRQFTMDRADQAAPGIGFRVASQPAEATTRGDDG